MAPGIVNTKGGSVAPATNGDSNIGPHPGFISSSNQYCSETKLRRMLRENGCDPAREDNNRLQGVQLIESVREYLKLPARTFDTACTYYHKFRLNFRDAEYNYQDAAFASLFVACKVEDTIKKSRDILAAAYNIKNPDKPVAADDKIFEAPSKIIIGLERHILETIGFDFRTRYPQKLLVKVVRSVLGRQGGADFYRLAYAMCTDMYKTFVPIKRTSLTMVLAIVELTARLRGNNDQLERIQSFAERKAQYSRAAVTETMLDLLDLYVQHTKSTKVGAVIDLNTFMDIKIFLNNELDRSLDPRYLYHCNRCEIEDVAPPTPRSATANTAELSTKRGQDGTTRFVFDPDMAKTEQNIVEGYFNDEMEEYEIEVEEPIVPPPQHPSRDAPRRDDGGSRGGTRGGYRGAHSWDSRGDPRRAGPYGGYRGDWSGRGRGRR